MECATGDAQKGPVLHARITTEGNDLKQTEPHNHAVDVVGEGNSEQHEKKSQGRNHTSASNLQRLSDSPEHPLWS